MWFASESLVAIRRVWFVIATVWLVVLTSCDMAVDARDRQDEAVTGTAVSAYTATTFDFIANAPSAAWTNQSGSVPWGTNEEYGRGACLTTTGNLEDGLSHPYLFTEPRTQVANTFMRGAYTVTIPAAAVHPTFKATFGFVSGANLWPGTDGATFKLTTLVNGSSVTLFSSAKSYSGVLSTVSVDLSAYAGQTLQLFLSVEGGANTTKDYGAWTEARIIADDLTRHYDFIVNAPGATWSNNDGGLSWLTNEEYGRGACLTTTETLEDGLPHTYLFTEPKHNVANAFMRGAFTVSIPAASLHPTFTATFGFRSSANLWPATDGVTFKLTTYLNGSWVTLFSQWKGFTGTLSTVTADLSPYAGQTLQLFLIAEAGANTTKDYAAWTDARVVVDSLTNPPDGCTINGVQYANGVVNPAVSCQVCDPTSSATTWSVKADFCFIGGQCYTADTQDGSGCNRCDPLTVQTSWTPKSVCSTAPVVTVQNYDGTALGTLQSKSQGDTFAYLGVPYAAAPVGSRRLAPPAKATGWSGVRNAFTQPPPCPQPPFVPLGGFIGSEDCLYLNVWTPKTATPTSNLPVLVYHHGGGFMFGGSNAQDDWLGVGVFDGDRLAASQNAIVVTIQSRLAALGYLAHASLSANATSQTSNTVVNGVAGTSGNYGLLDALQALKWVKKNIAAFGGNKDRVTFFGHSGGASLAGMLMTSPLAKDPADNKPYFASVILQSGFYEEPPMSSTDPAVLTRYKQALDSNGNGYLKTIGCDTASDKVACLRSASTQKFMDALGPTLSIFPTLFNQATPPAVAFGLAFGPGIDGYVLPAQPRVRIAAGQHNPMPAIVGTNKDEANTFMVLMLGGIATLNLSNFVIIPTCINRDIRATTNLGQTLANLVLPLYPCNWLGIPIIDPTVTYARAVTHAQYECPARRLLRALATGQPTVPVRRYWWTHKADHPGVFQNMLFLAPQIGAAHALDIPYVFNTHGSMLWYWPSLRERALTTAMQSYWRAFAASGPTGDPNYTGGVNWPAYDKNQDNALNLKELWETGLSDPGIEVTSGIDTSLCDFWDNNFTLDGWH